MEELRKQKSFKILFFTFILISVIHIIYAIITHRGMYCDGAYFMICQLQNLTNGIYKIEYDTFHVRFCIMALMQSPILFAYMLGIKSKFILMGAYSFGQFAFPLLALLWNYQLTKRTKRTDILCWSIFSYGAILCLFMIFSVVETLIGFMFNFILWNYLASDIDYKKRDIVFIIFLLVMMAGTYEYISYLGIFFFTAHFLYVKREKKLFNKVIKSIIGYGSLIVSLFDIIYMINVPDEAGEIKRFFKEFHDYFYLAYDMNVLISIITLIILGILIFKKKYIGIISLIFFTLIYTGVFIYLTETLQVSLIPMFESHCRTIVCYASIIIFIGLFIKDIINRPINQIRISNFICISLICCIFQTCWQMVNTYYWNENISYMKKELANENSELYIPEEHEEIASFFNPELRRYIWHGVYPATSIIFSDTYELKTLLVSYKESLSDGDVNERENLFVADGKMRVPFGANLDLKNEFWDLTKCAEALDKFNKENSIETNE